MARVTVGERVALTMDEANAVCCVVVDNRNVGCVIVVDEEYPTKVCFTMIAEMFREFYKTYNLMEIDSVSKDCDMKVVRYNEMIKNY